MTSVTFDTFDAFVGPFRGVWPLMFGIVLAFVPGCEQGAEGDRCNPYLSHDECNSGLVCAGHAPSSVVIPFCQENYCCPVDRSGQVTGANPNCEPGCNGSAAVLCADTMDPGACLLSEGGSLAAALALDDAGDGSIAPLPPGGDAGSSDSASSANPGDALVAATASAGPTGSE